MYYLLVDGFNLAYRSFYAIPELKRTDGFPTNALHGWLRTLWKLLDTQQPERVCVFFDLGGAQDKLALHPEYKAQRKETPEALVQQFPYIKTLSHACGWTVIEDNGIEADDLLASAALKLLAQGHRVGIVSADKDFAQLVRPGLDQIIPPPTANPKLGWTSLDAQAVHAKFGVSPEQIPDYLALIGDSSDNIPGIPGVGPKTAVRWLEQWGHIAELLKHSDQVKPERFQPVLATSRALLEFNLKLVTLNSECKLPTLDGHPAEISQLEKLLTELEMKTTLKEMHKRYGPPQMMLL
ncbi:MAG: 5'-3' exonuclease [Verrucomicrobia bacterium 21-51-4]|nr:MAG: 5'-3' exonuclease [Verrucomicrobia bacterium 21-51-4]HQU08644.1 5'-3' exonuclease H3TH domain-containing protein [Opitutales bacterium]